MSAHPGALATYLAERDRIAGTGWYEGAESALADLMSAAVVELAGEPLAGVAVVATGGFGRGLMAIASDVDLLFLHSGSGEDEIARRVLRPLWDGRLKVGHVSHTPRSARTFARARLDAVSTLLSARLLCGDAAVFEEFRARFGRLLVKERARIVALIADEERRRRDAEPYRLMAADLKSGRGGLRTLDMLDWRRLLEAAGEAHAPVDPREAPTRAALMRIRSALHVAAGKRLHDRYDFELRHAAARWLGTDVASLGRDLLELRSQAEMLVDDAWPEVSAPGVPRGTLAECTRPEHRGDLVWWWTAGHLDAFPPLRRLLDVPHVVPFHRYPVADHTMAAVDRVWAILEGADADPMVGEVAARIEDHELLVLGALFHDVGKGGEGDHARAGAAIVDEVASTLGLSDERATTLGRLVEHHLLLADLATRFDHDDPSVLAWVAERVVDHHTLDLLYVLTVSDSQATGSDTWNPWRAELLRRSYRRMERELARRSLPEAEQVALLVDQVFEASGGTLDLEEIRVHLSGLSEGYRTSHSPAVIRDHIHLARRPLGPGGGLVSTLPGTPMRITVLATDRQGLLLDVAGVLALNDVSVIDARFATRADGRVFDTFEVVDAGGGEMPAQRADRVQADLERCLRGGFDTQRGLAAKQRAYRHTRRAGIVPHVTVDRLGAGGGRVEIECADRVGLLRSIAEVFSGFGMPITRARVDTRAGVAYDTFQVARIPADTDPLVRALLDAVG